MRVENRFRHLPTNRYVQYTLPKYETFNSKDFQTRMMDKLINEFHLFIKKEETYMRPNFTLGELYLPNRNVRPEVKNVIFSGPCTIVQWTDGDKTMVRCENEDFDKEKGLAMAIAKKFLGTNKNKSNYYDIFEKWISEEEEIRKAEKECEESITYYTVKEYATLLGISESTVLKDIKKGKLPGSKKVDGKWSIPSVC